MLSPKVVITGGNGFVGSYLTRLLLRNSFEVISIDCKPSNNPLSGVEYLVQDLVEMSNHQLKYILKDSTLVHLAAISSSSVCEESPDLAINMNVSFVLKLIESANIAHTPIIFASSEWVYPDSATPEELAEDFQLQLTTQTNLYAMTKLIGEWMLKKYCQNYQILRFGIVYGEREAPQSAIEKIIFDAMQSAKVQVGNFLTSRRFIHVEDLCSGILECLIKPSINETFNLSGEKLVSLNEIVAEIEKIFDFQIKKSELGQMPSIRNPVPNKFFATHNWKPNICLSEGVFRLGNFYTASEKGIQKQC